MPGMVQDPPGGDDRPIRPGIAQTQGSSALGADDVIREAIR